MGRISPIIIWFLVGCSLMACSSQNSDNSNNRAPVAEQKKFEGDLVSEIEKTYFDQGREKIYMNCELENRDIARIVAKELQARKQQIEDLVKKLQTSSGEESTKRFTKIGNYYFTNPTKADGKDQWIDETNSWKEIYSYLLEIQNRAVDTAWISFDSEVRGFVSDEIDRIEKGYNFSSGRLSEPFILSVHEQIVKCQEDLNCNFPSLSHEQTDYLNSGYIENMLMKDLISSKLDVEQRKQKLKDLLTEVEIDLARYKFTLNSDIKNIDNKIVVPLDASVFGSASVDFKNLIESFWKDTRDPKEGSGLEVKVLLVNRPTPSFQVLIEDVIGRAFVSIKKRSLNLFKLSRVKSAAHEFGHVIGLSDRYYSTFDTKTCLYRTEFNPGDIMSDSESGQVVPSHWTEILRYYPSANPTEKRTENQ